MDEQSQGEKSTQSKESFYSDDPYVVLGVSQTSTEDEVTLAYRRLILMWHPDRNPDPEANEITLRINGAYKKLIGPDKKLKSSKVYQSATDGYRQNTNGSPRSSSSSSRATSGEYGYGTGEPSSHEARTMDPTLKNLVLDSLAIQSAPMCKNDLQRIVTLGYSEAQLRELLESDEAKVALESNFLFNLRRWALSLDVMEIEAYINEWKSIMGIDMSVYFHQPKAEKQLQAGLRDIVMVGGLLGLENYQAFIVIWRQWRTIDFTSVFQSSEVVDKFKDDLNKFGRVLNYHTQLIAFARSIGWSLPQELLM